MHIVLLTPGRWFPREHLVHVLARRLVQRGHQVALATERPMLDLCDPVPLPEGAARVPDGDFPSAARAADVLCSVASWPGAGLAALQQLPPSSGRERPRRLRYLDHALEPAPRPDHLRDEGDLRGLVDRMLVLSEAAAQQYRGRLPESAIQVLGVQARSLGELRADPGRAEHPLLAIDRSTFGCIEDYDTAYGVHRARANADALSIVEALAVQIEQEGERPAAGRELRYPEHRVGMVRAQQDGVPFLGRADDLVIQGMRHGGWEPAFVQRFFQLARDHRCEWMLDIGSHLGLYGILAAARHGMRSHLFEPQRALYENAVANAHLADVVDRVQVHHAAVSDREARLVLRQDFGVLGRVTLQDAGSGAGVRSVLLDRFLPEVMPVQGQRIALKVDVEGHGGEVLRGARELLASNHCVLQVEKSRDAVDADLAALGYRCCAEVGHNQWYEPSEGGREVGGE